MNYGKQKQEGVVLVVAIIILLILTFIGVSTFQTTPLEEKMASNYQQSNLAFQAADSADRQAEAFLSGLSDTRSFTNSGGLYTSGNAPDALASSTWSGSGVRTSTLSIPSVASPQYFVELVGTFSSGSVSLNTYNYGQDPNTGPVTIFRIVVRATDGSNSAETIVQSFYGVRF